MWVRLTEISLHCGRLYEVGEEVSDSEVPATVLQARLDAGTAERVEGVAFFAPELNGPVAGGADDFDTRLARFSEQSQATFKLLAGLVRQAGDEGEGPILKLHQLLSEQMVSRADLGRRLEVLFARAAETRFQSPPTGDSAGGDQDHSGVEQPAARLTHNQEVAGANPAPAPTDTPEQTGADVEAEEASPSSAENDAGDQAPAEASAPDAEGDQPARKGGRKPKPAE